MINTIKKIAVAILSMIVVAGVFAPFATSLAATFNTVAGDYAMLQVSNYTQHPESNTHWAGSISANAGEIVSFVAYYYNTAEDDARGTYVRVQLPSGSFTSTAITGDVRATNASTVTGNVTVNLTSAQSLTLIPGSVKWYSNQSTVAHSLLNGQSGAEVLSSNGLYLGNIAHEGWGTVVFRAQVSTSSVIPNPQPNGSAPSVSTNSAYSIGQNSATLQSSVNPNNAATNAWFEYGTSQSFGNTTSYQSVGAGNGSTNVVGSLSNLSSNTTYYYRAVAQNAHGTSYGNTLSFVTTGAANNGSAPIVSTNSAYSITQNSATVQSSVNPNNAATNAWFEYGTTQSFGNTSGYQSIGAGGATNVTAYLSNLSANATYYYRAVAQNAHGTSYGNTLNFTMSNTSNNGSAPLVSTNSAYSISQSSATVQSSVNPNNSGTNTWFEYGTTQSFGNTSGYQSIGAGNGTTNATAYLSNLSANTTYYYRAVAQNSYGTTYGSTMNFSTVSSGSWNNNGSAPIVYTNTANYNGSNAMILNGSVNPNSNYTNVWFEYGLNQSLGYSTGYQSAGSASQSSGFTSNVSNLAPGTTYYYRAVAQNSYGTTYGSIVSFTTSGSVNNNNNNSSAAPFVTTRTANSIFRNTALINGSTNANGSLSTAWFEWGETNGMGNRTMVQPMGQSNSVSALSAVLSGLRSGTTYYYRAVAQNGYGTAYGHTLTFTTLSNQVAPIVVNNTVTEPRVVIQQISGTPITGPTVVLIPSIDNKSPKAGDTIEYSIVYRNETSRAITNSTLKISLPNEVKYVSATLLPSLSNDHEATFDLGTISANSQGTITIKATVDSTIDNDSALVFGATLNYNDYRRQFQSTTAYLTVMVGAGVAGLASLMSTLGALFTNWFVDLILGLLIGFGIYHFFVREKEEEVLIK